MDTKPDGNQNFGKIGLGRMKILTSVLNKYGTKM
jgi:hypothetical protein